MNGQIEQRTPEWLEARVGRITGSRIASVLGHSPWMSRAALLKEMVAEAMGQFTHKDSPAMRWGRDHEQDALDDLLAMCEDCDDMVPGGWHTLGDELGYSPDGIVPGRLLVEVKAPFSRLLPDAPPAHYVDQVQLGMRVCDLPEAALHIWTPTASATFFLPRDDIWWEQAQVAIRDFLAEYRAALLDPAAWTAEERTDEPWARAVAKYRDAKIAADATAAWLERARAALVELSGERTAYGAGGKVEWVDRPGNVNWQKLAGDFHISKEQQDGYRGKSTRYARVTVNE